MKIKYSTLVSVIPIVIILYFIPTSVVSFSRSYDTIDIKSMLTKGDFMTSDLFFQKSSITFGGQNKICPHNDCSYEFEKTSLDEDFGAGDSKYLSGTLRIQDKANPEDNFIPYRYYKISGTFNLVNKKDNITTGERVLIYQGDLVLDTGNEMIIPPRLEYKSQILLDESNDNLELIGKIDN